LLGVLAKFPRMHILIINCNLNGLAPACAAVPGLISKTWLANEETNTYGGVYLWESKQAMLDYKDSEIYAGIGANPALVNITATDFEVLEGPSKVTRVG
jgi:hypothetical protein